MVNIVYLSEVFYYKPYLVVLYTSMSFAFNYKHLLISYFFFCWQPTTYQVVFLFKAFFPLLLTSNLDNLKLIEYLLK